MLKGYSELPNAHRWILAQDFLSFIPESMKDTIAAHSECDIADLLSVQLDRRKFTCCALCICTCLLMDHATSIAA